MGVDEWGAVWRLLAVCVGAGGSIVAVFWGLMLIFKPVARNAAANATERLHEKGLVSNPVGKAKPVLLTKAGLRQSEEAFRHLFETED